MEFRNVSEDVKLEIQVVNHPEHTKIQLKGELDMMGEGLLNQVISAVPYQKRAVVDLREISFFLPSLGYRFLHKLAKKTKGNGNRLQVIANEGSSVHTVFRVMQNSENLFDISFIPSRN